MVSLAIEVCKRNYKTNCGNCEIRKACVRPIGAGRDELEKWERELEEAAGLIERKK